MFKKYFLFAAVIFSSTITASPEDTDQPQKQGWSTTKKVLVGTAIVGGVAVAGVTIYYGPVAVLSYVQATAVSAATHVASAVSTVQEATEAVAATAASAAGAAGNALKDSVVKAWKERSLASVIIATGKVSRLGFPSNSPEILKTPSGETIRYDDCKAAFTLAVVLLAIPVVAAQTMKDLSDNDTQNNASIGELDRIKLLEKKQSKGLAERIKQAA